MAARQEKWGGLIWQCYIRHVSEEFELNTANAIVRGEMSGDIGKNER
jgi:hypothetical protein